MIYAMVDMLGKTTLVGSYTGTDYIATVIVLCLACVYTSTQSMIRSGKFEYSLSRVFILALFFLWPGHVAFAASILSILTAAVLRRFTRGSGTVYAVVSGISFSIVLFAGSFASGTILTGMPSPITIVMVIPVAILVDIASGGVCRLTDSGKRGFLDNAGKQLIFYIAVLPLALITVVLILHADTVGGIIAAVSISGFSMTCRSIQRNHRFNQERIRAIGYQDRLATELMKSSSYSQFVRILEDHYCGAHDGMVRVLTRSSGIFDWTMWSGKGQSGVNESDIAGEIPSRGRLSRDLRAGETEGLGVGLSESGDLLLLVGGSAVNIFLKMPSHLLDNLVLLLRHTWEAVGHSMRSERSFLAAAVMLARLADSKDDYTHGHSVRVSGMATALGRILGLSEESLSTLRVGGILHDIGKLAIPNEILTKRGLLTKNERRIIQNHPVEGARIVSELSGYDRVTKIIRSHHERLDGSGYPDGLSGIDIPFLARIVAVADTFDAITSARSYHSIAGWDNAMATIREVSGIHFDSRVVDALEIIVNEGSVNWA